MEEKRADETLSIEELFAQIEELTDRMEDPDTSLEAGFALYQEGVGKLKEAKMRLEAIETRVRMLQEQDITKNQEQADEF